MNDLIARLESAERGSRDLDYRIHGIVMGWRMPSDEHPFSWSVMESYQYGAPDNERLAIYIKEWELPEYTRSLDAALTLVPEGWIWKLDGGNDASYCLVGRPTAKGNFGFPHKYSGFNRTPALALCVAALRARQHKSEAA